jgi:hypothetical protein
MRANPIPIKFAVGVVLELFAASNMAMAVSANAGNGNNRRYLIRSMGAAVAAVSGFAATRLKAH